MQWDDLMERLREGGLDPVEDDFVDEYGQFAARDVRSLRNRYFQMYVWTGAPGRNHTGSPYVRVRNRSRRFPGPDPKRSRHMEAASETSCSTYPPMPKSFWKQFDRC